MILREAGDVLNDIIHSEILKHSNHDLKLNLHKFNIEVQINNINPSLIMDVYQVNYSHYKT